MLNLLTFSCGSFFLPVGDVNMSISCFICITLNWERQWSFKASQNPIWNQGVEKILHLVAAL